MTKTTDIGQLLLEAAQGSSAAADALLPLVYNDLRALAGYFMKGE
ncbi:MAG: ECF-type sigma factor, partial [Nannocystaceae bacterium]